MKASSAALRRAAGEAVAVIPMGSFEAHGPHLPCGTDCMLVEGIVAAAAGQSDPDRVVVFPTVVYSVVEWARPFGSVGVSPATLMAKLVDVARDVHRLGFRKIVFVQGHGNMPAAQMAIWQLRYEGARALYVDANPYLMAAEQGEKIAGERVTHAGVVETSLMLALHPERVEASKAVDGPGDLYGDGFPYATLRDRAGVFAFPVATALPEGVEGRPSRAHADMGRRLLALYAGALAEVLKDLLAHDVPPMFLEGPRTDAGARRADGRNGLDRES